MKTWMIPLGLFLSPCFAADANVGKAPEVVKIQVGSGQKPIRVFGRVVPEVGAVRVQTAEGPGRIESLRVHPGDRVTAGSPILAFTGASCLGKSRACDLPASVDGVVDEVLKPAGAAFERGDGLVSVFNPRGLKVRLDVPVKSLRHVKVGQRLTLRGAAGSSVAEARVLEIMPSLGAGETTRGVRLELTAPWPELRPDSVVSAEIPVPLSGLGTRVPARAVAYLHGRHYVVRRTAGEFHAVPVNVESETGDSLWISAPAEDPLKDGDVILSESAIFYLPRLLEKKAD